MIDCRSNQVGDAGVWFFFEEKKPQENVVESWPLSRDCLQSSRVLCDVYQVRWSVSSMTRLEKLSLVECSRHGMCYLLCWDEQTLHIRLGELGPPRHCASVFTQSDELGFYSKWWWWTWCISNGEKAESEAQKGQNSKYARRTLRAKVGLRCCCWDSALRAILVCVGRDRLPNQSGGRCGSVIFFVKKKNHKKTS